MHRTVSRQSILFVFLSLLSSGLVFSQVSIKERVDINPKQRPTNGTQQIGDQGPNATYNAPFDAWGTLAIWSYDYVWPGDATVVVNGNPVIDDVVWGAHYVSLGNFAQGTPITVSILHGDGSPWPVQVCAITPEMCWSDVMLAFSPELICGQEFEGAIPANISVNVHLGRITEEKSLGGNWNGAQLIFGESRSLTVAYQGLCGGSYPLADGTTFTFAITDGQQYARLLDPVTGSQVLSVAGIPQDNGIGTVQLVTVGNEPTDPALVTVQADVIGEGTTTITGQLTVKPGDLSIVPTRTTLTYGETLRLDVQERNGDGSLSSLPDRTTFTYSIESGADAGYLYNLDSTWTDDWISSYTPSAMFAAVEESPQPDVVQVKVRVEATLPGVPCEPPDCYEASMRPEDIKAIRKALSLSVKGNQEKKPVQPAKPRMNADSSYSFGTRKSTVSPKTSFPAATIQSSGGPLVGYALFEVTRPLGCSIVKIEPLELSAGDTAVVTILQNTDDGVGIPYPANQLFNVSLIEGEDLGKLVAADGREGNLIESTPQPLKLVAGQYLGAKISVFAEAVNQGVSAKMAMKTKSDKTSASHVQKLARMKMLAAQACHLPPEAHVSFENILLGESKYYAAAWVNEQLLIGGFSSAKATLALANRIDKDVINVQTSDQWEKAVYWETKKPNWDAQPNGVVRVIGRYWKANSARPFKIGLSVSDQGTASMVIVEVKEPNSLGVSSPAMARSHGIDVAGHPYNVDSVCIKWGGEYGFPPQNIKGQYESESVFDLRLQAYVPGYRYEAWTTEFKVDYLKETSHFWVTDDNMGDGDGVPEHNNTEYMAYVRTPHSVWHFIEQYSTIVHDEPPNGHASLFGWFHVSDGQMTFKYDRPRGEYVKIHAQVYDELGLDNNVENRPANLTVRERFIEYMSQEYFNDGLDNRNAQSRIASSYGPLQPLYITALQRQYPNGEHDVPENLNDLSIFFRFAMDHHRILLSNHVSDINSNDWNQGFEETMKMVYHDWNSRPGYDAGVMRNAQQYKPAQ
jgi:hypothetical protein